ncbi:MAG TPA: VOC family protein [Acidimicrobiia bacterium]|jgi:hypothetical protein|nr:VOC family protein [Acidimicrobiia bacterium]
MAINGIHILLYKPDAEAVRAVVRDVFGWSHVDAGDGWLIFAGPPAEVAVHPGAAPSHQLSLMCDEVAATMEELQGKGVLFRGEPSDEGWGTAITMLLPGDLELLLYEPRHPTAI